MSKVKLLLALADDLRALADSIMDIGEAIAENEQKAEKPPEQPKKKEPDITLEQVRMVLADKSHDGFTAEIRDLLQKYGATKLSGIDPADYAALLSDAKELGHGN